MMMMMMMMMEELRVHAGVNRPLVDQLARRPDGGRA